jgi:hypothetical protein
MVAVNLEKQALLTQARVREFFDYHPDIGILTHRTTRHNRVKVGDVLGYVHKKHGHIVCEVDGREYQLHRLIWLWWYGVWPSDQVDHENEIKTDNRIDNLRDASNAQNQRNIGGLQKNNKSGVRGVCWSAQRGKWWVQIGYDGKGHSVGFFDTLDEAARARRAAELQHFGEFAPA